MAFADLFEIESSGHRIDLLTHEGREDITNKTVAWWQSQGWKVVLWDNTGHPPAVGRNRIIKHFKESDRDILIMADDDITLYPHRFLTQEWLNNPLGNGVYCLNSNHKMNLLAQNSSTWNDGNHHWLRTDEISQFYVIDRKDIPYQDENPDICPLEDLDWAWQCWALGIECSLLHTVFLREQSQDVGSLIATDRRVRKQLYSQALEQIYQKWNVKTKGEFRKQYIKGQA
jgi:hypothetical protein